MRARFLRVSGPVPSLIVISAPGTRPQFGRARSPSSPTSGSTLQSSRSYRQSTASLPSTWDSPPSAPGTVVPVAPGSRLNIPSTYFYFDSILSRSEVSRKSGAVHSRVNRLVYRSTIFEIHLESCRRRNGVRPGGYPPAGPQETRSNRASVRPCAARSSGSTATDASGRP